MRSAACSLYSVLAVRWCQPEYEDCPPIHCTLVPPSWRRSRNHELHGTQLVRLRDECVLSMGYIIRFNVTNLPSPCVFFVCNTGVCSMLHVYILLRDFKGSSGQATTESVSSLVEGHFGTETVISWFERFSLSIAPSTLDLTKTLL